MKSHTGFPSVLKYVTLNDLKRREGRYHLSCIILSNLVRLVVIMSKCARQRSFRQNMIYVNVLRHY